MAAITDMLRDVRNDIDKMNHSRNAHSISHPMPMSRPLHSYRQATSEPETMIEDDFASADRPHTSTSTCCCATCVVPGDLTFDEYERHLNTKIEIGRREVESIEDQLTHCYSLMKTLNELEDHAVQLQMRDQPSMRGQLQTNDPLPADTPPSPLGQDESTRTDKRYTICGTTSPSASKMQQGITPGSSFSSVVPSSFYSERSSTEREDGSPVRPPPFSVPAPASSSQQARASRLSTPFSGSWETRKSPEPYAVSSGDYFDGVAKSFPLRSRNAEEHQHANPYEYPNIDKTLLPIQRAYTPRTQSTADLLGSFSSADFLTPANMPYASSHSPVSSIFNRRKGFVAVDTSEDYNDSSGTSTPQHTFKWHAQRMGGMRLMPRRRYSKADELLGFVTPEPGSRPTSAMSLRDTSDGPSEGKKSKLNMLKLSKLRMGKGGN